MIPTKCSHRFSYKRDHERGYLRINEEVIQEALLYFKWQKAESEEIKKLSRNTSLAFLMYLYVRCYNRTSKNRYYKRWLTSSTRISIPLWLFFLFIRISQLISRLLYWNGLNISKVTDSNEQLSRNSVFKLAHNFYQNLHLSNDCLFNYYRYTEWRIKSVKRKYKTSSIT